MKILIIEHDAALGRFLQNLFEAEGHSVRVLRDASTTVEEVEISQPHLLIADLARCGRQKHELLKTLKNSYAGTAIFVLTESVELADRIACLDAGADDCLAKPFSFQELMARCRALLRRKVSVGDNVLFNGPLALNRLERSVRIRGQALELTAKEFALLEQLMLANGRCCSREELLKTVFQSIASSTTNVVDVYITYLRKKLALATGCEMPGNAIETLRGAGYRLANVGNLFVGSESHHPCR